MDIRDALADDVSLKKFFTHWVPRLFEARKEDFEKMSDIPIILCFKFQDTGEVYSVEFSEDGAVVEEDEMIDFPMATVLGWAKFWPLVKREGRPLAEALESRRDEVRDSFRVTRAFHADWEKFDLVIDVEITGEGGKDPVRFSIVSNDYEAPSGARRFGFTVDLPTLDAVAAGKRDPVEAAKALKIKGDYAAAATLGGMILSHT